MTYAMEIAKAVRRAQWCCGDNLISDEEFQEIIASIQRPEPYCWSVDGCDDVFYGESAEYLANEEAERIGGSCKAFPLYAEPPATADSVNARLLDAAKAVSDGAWTERPESWQDHNKEWIVTEEDFNALREAIAAAEQQQAQPLPELSDEQLDACRRSGLIDSLADPYDYDNSGDEFSSAYRDLRQFARAAIAADRELRGVK